MGSATDSAGNETRDEVGARDAVAVAGDDDDLAWLDRPDVAMARRRTLRVLLVAQVLGSLGAGAAPSVGVLLAQEVTRSEGWAGIARASVTVGAALLALPLGILAARRGRRRALTVAWGAAAVGAALLVVAASARSVPVLVVGMMALGAGSAAGLQSRFAATDLAVPAHRARSLSLVVWVGTLGAVLGPNLGIPGKAVETRLGLPALSGAFVIGALLLAATAGTVWLRMRPDPLSLAATYRTTAPTPGGSPAPVNLRRALSEIREVPAARFALVALVLAHVAMVSVMTMTPVSLAMHGHSITVVGITISVHVLGMYAFAPVVGAAADRFGRMPVILAGQGVLAVSAALNVGAPSSAGVVVVGLFLLGLGWSIVTVPASTMLSQSVPAASRPLVQGAGDSAMNAAAAVGAIGSGAVMVWLGFAWLAGLAGALVLPVVWLALRTSRARSAPALAPVGDRVL